LRRLECHSKKFDFLPFRNFSKGGESGFSGADELTPQCARTRIPGKEFRPRYRNVTKALLYGTYGDSRKTIVAMQIREKKHHRGAFSALVLIPIMLLLAACEKLDDPTLHPAHDPETATLAPHRPFSELVPDRQLLWGDLHIHTTLSTDAYVMGVRTMPDDAYTFAKGGEISHAAGYGIHLSRPLDFAAVTDHAEYLGVASAAGIKTPLSVRSLRERLLHDSPVRNTIAFLRTTMGFGHDDLNVENSESLSLDAWQEIIEAAEHHYEPGRFTAFIGYEWTSMPSAQNLHRNVIYRSSDVPSVPFSALDSEDPRDLWTALEAQREQGMESIAIPHNSNVSGGKMYDVIAYDGTAFDADYATRRMRNEPISEVFQVKGSSEAHPDLSPDDEFAGFELFETLLSQRVIRSPPEGSYARHALRSGIQFAHDAGFNPYRFGVIGSSDGHNSSSPVEENNYHGKLPLLDGSAGIRLGRSLLLPKGRLLGRQWSSGGLAAVWAEENTRESIFDAMVRKETYATSGPRISVRFFGSWDFPEDILERSDAIARAYAIGVPMGGDLPVAEAGPPTFFVTAMKDPESGNLDRIQIVKGWIDAQGNAREKIFDVALSDGRTPDPGTGAVPPVGNTVDSATASYSNSIGAVQLATVWTDPDFDTDQEAFYYARVIEIPTPRWSTYDAVKLDMEPPDPTSIQERAVTSAIWHSPRRSRP